MERDITVIIMTSKMLKSNIDKTTDCFIDRLTCSNAERGKTSPLLVGLALDEQIIPDIPMEKHDRQDNIPILPYYYPILLFSS